MLFTYTLADHSTNSEPPLNPVKVVSNSVRQPPAEVWMVELRQAAVGTLARGSGGAVRPYLVQRVVRQPGVIQPTISGDLRPVQGGDAGLLGAKLFVDNLWAN